MSEYTTHDGNTVPTDVAEQFDPAAEWDDHYVDADSIPQLTAVFGELYEGVVDGRVQFVSEWGNPTPCDHFDFTTKLKNGELPFKHEEAKLTYGDYNVVHHDHYAEHVTRVIVVTESGRKVYGSRSGIVWPEYHMSDRSANVTDEVLELAMSLVDADNEIETPEQFGRSLGGWHSSLEKSEQSEKMNALAKGDVPPHMDDSDIYPYAVVYGDTNNVCTVNASVYGNETFTELIKQEFDGSRAAPGHGGFA